MQDTHRKQRTQVDLRALEVFVAVAQSGNMTQAAQRLRITQPTVSHAIAQLERELGVDLLDRHGRPLRLTPSGTALLERALGLLSEADALYAHVRLADSAQLPYLRLGLVDSFAVTVGPELIKSLQRGAEALTVWSGLSRQLVDGLLNRELDLLVSADAVEDVGDIERNRLLREPFVIATPKDASLPTEDLKQLCASAPLVRYSARSVTGAQVDRHLRRLRLEPPRRLEFDGSESVMAMVAAGIGWALTTPLCVLQGRASLANVVLTPLPSGVSFTRGLYLLSRRGEFASQRERVIDSSERLLRRLLDSELGANVRFATPEIAIGAKRPSS